MYSHPDRGDQYFCLPKHKELKRGLLRAMIRSLELTREEFLVLFRKLC